MGIGEMGKGCLKEHGLGLVRTKVETLLLARKSPFPAPAAAPELVDSRTVNSVKSRLLLSTVALSTVYCLL